MRRRLLCGIVLLAAAAVTFDDLLTGDRVPVYRDLLHFVLPLKRFLSEQLHRGEVPLWNPFVYMGTPFLANFQSGVFYPPSALLLLSFPLGLDLFLLAHYLIALGGMWVWLRHGRLSLTASTVGALVFALGGYLVSTMNVTNHLQGAVWAPWVLVAFARFVEQRTALRFATLVFTLSVQILAASPENLLLTLTIAAADVATRFHERPLEAARQSTSLAVALLFAVGLTMVQLLPTLEYLSHSLRQSHLSFDEVTFFSLQPVSLLQLLLPHSSVLLPAEATHSLGQALEERLTFLQSLYLGIIPLCLAVVGLVRSRDRWLWAALTAGALVLALGRHTPALPALYDAAPWFFGKFRYPEKFFFVVHLAAAVLAAKGTQEVLCSGRPAERLAIAAAIGFAAAGAVLLFIRTFDPEAYLRLVAILSGKYLPATQFVPLALDLAAKARRLLLLLFAFAGILLLRRRVLAEGTFCALLVMLVAVDLVSTHRHLNLNVSWSDLVSDPPLVPVAEARNRGLRIFHYQTVALDTSVNKMRPIPGVARWHHTVGSADDLREAYRMLARSLYANGGMLYDVGVVSGGDGITRSSDALLLSALMGLPRERAVRLLRLCSTGFLVGPTKLDNPGLERLEPAESSPFYAYRVDDPIPRVRLVSRLRAVPSDVTALRTMVDAEFAEEREAIVAELPPGWPEDVIPEPPAGEARLRSDAPDGIDVEVETQRRAFLVLNDSFFPGWEATIAGEARPIYRTNVFFRGVVIEPGVHLVEFRYRPRAFRYGAMASLASAVALGVGLAAMGRRRSLVRS